MQLPDRACREAASPVWTHVSCRAARPLGAQAASFCGPLPGSGSPTILEPPPHNSSASSALSPDGAPGLSGCCPGIFHPISGASPQEEAESSFQKRHPSVTYAVTRGPWGWDCAVDGPMVTQGCRHRHNGSTWVTPLVLQVLGREGFREGATVPAQRPHGPWMTAGGGHKCHSGQRRQ